MSFSRFTKCWHIRLPRVFPWFYHLPTLPQIAHLPSLFFLFSFFVGSRWDQINMESKVIRSKMGGIGTISKETNGKRKDLRTKTQCNRGGGQCSVRVTAKRQNCAVVVHRHGMMRETLPLAVPCFFDARNVLDLEASKRGRYLVNFLCVWQLSQREFWQPFFPLFRFSMTLKCKTCLLSRVALRGRVNRVVRGICSLEAHVWREGGFVNGMVHVG